MQRRVSPKTEEVLRGIFVILAALTLPFVVAWHLGMGLIAPGYMRRRSAERRARLDKIRLWQEAQLSNLRSKPFQELSALPAQTQIPAPSEFAGERFAIVRAAGENGGVEIGVAHFMRVMGIVMGQLTPRFEMLSDGSIVEEPASEPDD
jgi:hypothetical protein